MTHDEFMKMCVDAGFINEQFTERDATIAFALSMMTQIDELDNDKHMRMNLLEFMEALARAADAVSLPPYESNVCSLYVHL